MQPELYAVENRDKKFEKIQKFKKSLFSFNDNKTENFFFDAIIYGLVFKLSEGKSLTRGKVESVLGRGNFCDVKDQLKLETSIYGFFDKCAFANELSAKRQFSLKFYERRDRCRYLIKEGATGKNKIARDLSSSIIKSLMAMSL